MKQQRQQSRCEESPELKGSPFARDLAKSDNENSHAGKKWQGRLGDGGGKSSATNTAGRRSAL